MNDLYCDDCLNVIPKLEPVDLIYLDPPFNCGQFVKMKMDDYIDWLKPRVEACYDVLKPTGSLYLHCDWHANHYIRLMLDEIFGEKNFRNEIVWCYTGPGSPNMKQFNRKHDTIFWYTKSKKSWIFEKSSVLLPHSDSTIQRFKYRNPFPGKSGLPKGGKVPEDWWSDIAIAVRSSKERNGYPTQKPLKLMERIIKATSNKGDVVLDPMCGGGTTIVKAQMLDRKWIGIDINKEAIRITKERLK